jgi:UDP-glucose 4,6-dehydratase
MILLIGSTGYIGTEFVRQLKQSDIDFITISHIEIFNMGLKSLLENVDFVINASGYTGKPNVDKCEQEKDKCVFGNVLIPTKLVEGCREMNIPYGHVSSGCIYTGRRQDGNGFTEEDEPNFTFKYNNCSFYSGTKAMAEDIVKQYDKSYIWRLRIPFDEENSPRNYITKVLTYNKLIDYENSVSHRKDYVSACIEMIKKISPFGIYNIVNTGVITTKQVAKWVNEYISDKQFQFFESEEEFYNTVAKTPRSNCILNNDKLLKLGISMRSVEEAFISSLKNWKI